MAIGLLSFLTMQAMTLAFGPMVRPRRPIRHALLRSWQGMVVDGLVATALFGVFLAISGNPPVAAVAVTGTFGLFVFVSNAKYAMLGEPLLFSDLALFAALFRQPAFYLGALSRLQKFALVLVIPALLAALALLFVPYIAPHAVGIGMSVSAAWIAWRFLRGQACAALAAAPDIGPDIVQHGLMTTLLLYWLRWRDTSDPAPVPTASKPRASAGLATPHGPDLIVVVQCESFADPVALTGEPRTVLPGLARARAASVQWGKLNVSGFGAYTMRTEFGVLFGRSETALGFRRYDPFLTAQGEASYALSSRLGSLGYQCTFVHPHDLRFYSRDRLMPRIGFDQMIGEDRFPSVPPGGGRYVDDRTLGRVLCDLIDATVEPTFFYVVTMENHGPWMKDRLPGSPGGLDAYLRHVRNSDAMLDALIDHLAGTGRSALMVFFGDHRPSIPGATEPGGERDTPYVMLRFPAVDATGVVTTQPIDLTPDELHHAILRAAGQG